MSLPKPPLILILGPTAVGKTDLAIRLAQTFQGEIVSADSRLFYRGMDIGTAKPTPEEMRLVKHHLIDVADPDETWSLALFQQKAKQIIGDLHRQNILPFLVGGTGQYIRAVTEGWLPPEVTPDLQLRIVLENLAIEHSPYWLHDRLRILDPVSADNIDPRNLRRTIRALEVILSTGFPFSSQRRTNESEYRLVKIGLIRPREELYQRVDLRIDTMFANGFLDEVQRLLNKGFSESLPSMSAIGYREAIQVLHGNLTIEQAKTEMKRITRVFVRRQANWFKIDDPSIKWFSMRDGVDTDIETYLQKSLASQK